MQKNLRFIFIMFFITLLMSCSEEKADPVGLNGKVDALQLAAGADGEIIVKTNTKGILELLISSVTL